MYRPINFVLLICLHLIHCSTAQSDDTPASSSTLTTNRPDIEKVLDIFGRRFIPQVEKEKEKQLEEYNETPVVKFSRFVSHVYGSVDSLSSVVFPIADEIISQTPLSNECTASLAHLIKSLKRHEGWTLKSKSL